MKHSLFGRIDAVSGVLLTVLFNLMLGTASQAAVTPLAQHAAIAAPAVERWGNFELTLTGPASGNPHLDVQWSTTFTQGDRAIVVSGFWDGGDTYRVRFSPPTPGEWRYETRSATPELNGKNGAFTATKASGRNHGPIEIFDTFHLRYADGTPYHQFGTTCYVWTHQTPALQEQTLKTLAASPFNKIRFCVFPKSYSYNQNEPEFFAFKKGADGKFDFNQPDPAFWHHFEQRILDLQKLGIEADLILWHPYDRWGFKKMRDAEDDRYLRYCIARLAAFRNVWWSLANEYDFMSDLDERHRGIKTMDDWDRFFSILQREDPYGRMRGIHNGSIWYDHTKACVTHASIQTSDMNAGVRFREKYQKPVIYDECKYEGNIPQGWGNLDAKTMTQRFWLGTMSGCYVGHGETYQHPEDILWWSKGGVLHGESPERIQWLKDFMAKAPPFHELQPLGDDKGRFLLGKPGEYYLVYCLHTRPQSVMLAGSRPYKVDAIDPWAMTTSPVGTARSGAFTVNSPKADTVFRFTPYAAGEPLRPEARIQATPTEGMPPLAVAFKAVSDAAQAEWDFGDGSQTTGREAQHTFTQPGIHTVTLKVTGQNGASAIAYAEVVTDRDVTKPIVQAGFAGNEQPALKLHGTAKRGAEGALLLPSDAPWGWVQAGDKPLEDLRGLRSFTISGWVRPASLETGAGGNRIVFCLNKATDGIDLVCHADGRLRLAVNQWPDGIKNDSSPGKLVVGKWTFFTVTYDASRSQENVSWYFSPPLDAPGAADVKLDRTTTYNHGPVGTDIGPLVIGNFNDTMRSHGLDRQFRGEIRGLQIFGSRVGGRGAMSLEEIRKLMLLTVSTAHAAERPAAAKVAPSSDVTRESLAVSDGYLLLDSRVVAETQNARLALGAVQKHASNPLMAEDKPWEVRFDNLYANVLYDPADRLYKCWYSPFVVDLSSKGMALEQRNSSRYRPPPGREMGVCYAVSPDGLQWEKPELNLVAFEGSKANNLVLRGPHGAGILMDTHDPNPQRRYKMFHAKDVLRFSADGLHWSDPAPCSNIGSKGDTHNNLLWAPGPDRFIGFVRLRDENNARTVGRTESADLTTWTKAVEVLRGDRQNQTYSMPVFHYANVYLGLVAIFRTPGEDRVHTELAWSPDTMTWHRIQPGTPFIGNSPNEGDYDWGCVYAAASPVVLKDEIRIYYGGSNGKHTSWRDGFLCLASLRPDGWAGYEPEDAATPAIITTRPVTCRGATAWITCDVRRGGQVKVTALDESRAVADSTVITTTSTRAPAGQLSTCRNLPVTLRLEITNAKVFSFGFSDSQ